MPTDALGEVRRSIGLSYTSDSFDMSQSPVRTATKRGSASVGTRLTTGQFTRDHVENTATAREAGTPLGCDDANLKGSIATQANPAGGAVRTTGNPLIAIGGALPTVAAIHSVCLSQSAAYERLIAVCICCWWLPIAAGVALIRTAEAMGRGA
jgi:hypothetical protein